MPRLVFKSNGNDSHIRSLQLAVIAILITIFIAIASHQIWRLRVAAERVAVMQMVGNLRSVIAIEFMERVLHGRLDTVMQMNHADPMLYLKQVPANFEAVTGSIAPRNMKPYRWYYEATSGILTYRVGNGDYLKTSLRGPKRIRFQLQVRYEDINRNHRFDPKVDVLKGVDLVALDRYSWLPVR